MEEKSSDDITRFLPQYPNIKPYENNLYNPYNGDFYNAIYKKKEFYDLRLDETEEFPSQPGVLMNHQKIIARFLSSHTLYNGILLFHEMGTGKTCSAIAAIEQIRSEGKFEGAVYIASKVLANNFLNELINICTDGRYIPEETSVKLTKRQQEARYKKAVEDYYRLGKDYTYQKFAKQVGRLSDEELRNRYNNHVIVIDEVHNLADITNSELSKKGKKTIKTYAQIWRFLHVVQGCKVLLLSGTPMRNKVSDIASVMNLLLPLDEQLVTGKEFINTYFNIKEKDLAILTQQGASSLRGVFKGRVSYLRAITSDVDRKFHGTTITVGGEEKYFKVSESKMSPFQTLAYEKAWRKDGGANVNEEKDQSGVYLNSRQASLFVYPDSSWGPTGFNKFLARKKVGVAAGAKRKRKRTVYDWTKAGADLRSELRKDGVDALKKYSCKYAASLSIIQEAIKKKKLVFIYNEFLKGSGIIVFALILKTLGFTEVTTAVTGTSKPTFAVLTGDTPDIPKIIRIFNQPENYDGSLINVIIGSKAVAEGVSLQNIQVEIIQTPWFNYARTDQALARGYRFGSHRILKEKGDDIIQDIYQQVAMPDTASLTPESSASSSGTPPPPLEDVPSIDMYMYQLAQKKDISFKVIETIMRSTAFDCALTYKRNRVDNKYDDTRGCNYIDCDYECDGVPTGEYKGDGSVAPQDIDYSTYQLYYATEDVDDLVQRIVMLFRTDFILSYLDIADELSQHEHSFVLLTALEKIISDNIPIYNRYGFTSYLQEENDMYFLVDSLSTIGTASMAYYTKNPNVEVHNGFSAIREKYFIDIALPRAIREMCSSKADIRPYLVRLPVGYREMMLENAVKVQILAGRGQQFTSQQIELARRVVEYFTSYIKEIPKENLLISSLLETVEGGLRCLDLRSPDLVWTNCTTEQKRDFAEDKVRLREELENFDFYGLLNSEGKEFCIRDVRGGTDVGGHKLTAGARCDSSSHNLLIYLSVFYADMPVPPRRATLDFILSNQCGPSVKKNKGKFTDTQRNEINNGVVRVEGNRLIYLKDFSIPLGERESLEKFLLNTADKVRSGKGRAWQRRWFVPGEPIFQHLVESGGDPHNTTNEKWESVKRGIRNMTVGQMQSLIYYGSLKKLSICMFLCAWFHDNNLLGDDPQCGSGNKTKPIKKSKKESQKGSVKDKP